MPDTLDTSLVGVALAALVAAVALAATLAKLVSYLVRRRNGQQLPERRHQDPAVLAFRGELREHIRRDDEAHQAIREELRQIRNELLTPLSLCVEGIRKDVEWLKARR